MLYQFCVSVSAERQEEAGGGAGLPAEGGGCHDDPQTQLRADRRSAQPAARQRRQARARPRQIPSGE